MKSGFHLHVACLSREMPLLGQHFQREDFGVGGGAGSPQKPAAGGHAHSFPLGRGEQRPALDPPGCPAELGVAVRAFVSWMSTRENI